MGCGRAVERLVRFDRFYQVDSNRPIYIFHSLIMEFTGSVTAADVPPVKKLHSFLLSEIGTQSRKVKYWGLTKEEAYAKAKKSHPEKNILWLKELV
tara:strand:- start:59 stop:346 length:288 start_codon:yes stop_codon:yes gene_type:complete